MKRTLLTLIFGTFCLFAFAQQDIVVAPNPVEVDGEVTDTDIEAHNFITNNTDAEVRLRWKRISEDMPDSWTSWVCDNNLCYGPSTDQTPDNRPVVIGQGQNGIMIMHVDPEGNPGVGTIMLEITMFDDPSVVIDTAIYIFNALTVGTVDVEREIESLHLFPNPANDYVQLSTNSLVDQLAIYNVVGKQMMNYRYQEGRRYDISSLPAGFYLVSLRDEKAGVVKTLRLQKR